MIITLLQIVPVLIHQVLWLVPHPSLFLNTLQIISWLTALLHPLLLQAKATASSTDRKVSRHSTTSQVDRKVEKGGHI